MFSAELYLEVVIVKSHKAMPIVLSVDSIHLLSKQRSIYWCDRLLILCGGHVVWELIEVLILGGPLDTVESSGPDSFRLGQALPEVLLSPVWMVPASRIRRLQCSGLELDFPHHWSARVSPVVLFSPLWVHSVPFTPPFLGKRNNIGKSCICKNRVPTRMEK